MLDFEPFFFLVLYLIFIPIYLLNYSRKGYFFLHSVFFLYILGVISVTLFPIPLFDVHEEKIDDLYHNWIPLATISDMLRDRQWHIIFRQLLGNLVLFLPLGFFIPLLSSRKITWLKIITISFLTSLTIESLQLFLSWKAGFTYKIFDVDDLILNSLGAMFGYGIFKLWKHGKNIMDLRSPHGK